MFEGKLPKPPHTADSSALLGSGDSLREMTWSDLRARLDAARDLRLSFVNCEHEAAASFDAHSARRIAALANGKDAVNPEDLAIGKGTDCIDVRLKNNDTRSDRGNT